MNIKVFPCNGKVPLIKDWQRLASDDPTQIEKWRQEFGPRLTGFGVPCGELNHIYVLDVDVKKGKNGFETLKSFTLPETVSQRTPSGGAHYFFKYPNSGGTYPNRAGFLPGLDTRSDGGYVLYYGADLTKPLADCPEWLWKDEKKIPQTPGEPVAVAPIIVDEILNKSLDAVRNAPPGESNHILNVEAFRLGQLVASGSLSRVFAETKLFEAAKARGKPDYEAKRTIESGLNGGMGKPLTSVFGAPDVSHLPPIPDVPTPAKWTPEPFTADQLFDTSKLRRPQLFQDWSTKDIQITTADGGTGKTTLKLFEAICLALGERFLGFQCVNPGKTLFITGEDTAAKLGAMIGAICKQMGLVEQPEKLKIVMESVIVKKDSDLCVITKDRSGFLQPNDASFAKVYEAIQEIKPVMVVFDPISSFWGSESALNDMAKAVIRFMSRLVEECGVCVEMINHMGKVSSGAKDMTQFAGRGGTGIPSHSRVGRVLRQIDEAEYTELTKETLGENQTAILCNVNKFTDGSPLFNKPFLIMREGYLFSRKTVDAKNIREEKEKSSDVERVFKYVEECRSHKQFPNKSVIVAHFMMAVDKISEARVKRSLEWLRFNGYQGRKLAEVQGPDATQKEQVWVIVDSEGREIHT